MPHRRSNIAHLSSRTVSGIRPHSKLLLARGAHHDKFVDFCPKILSVEALLGVKPNPLSYFPGNAKLLFTAEAYDVEGHLESNNFLPVAKHTHIHT